MMHPDPDLIALGIRQPWAELILRGIKTIEVRSLGTQVRGPIYLYTGKQFADIPAAEAMLQRHAIDREELTFSRLVGTVEIVSSRPCTADDAEAMRQQCAVDGVIPARGLLQNPALLRDIHDHCHNRPPTPLSNAERIDFLRDIAAASGQRPGANHGFVLRVAAGLYGRDSALFRALATCRNLRMANECLNRADAAPAPRIGKDQP